MTFLDESTNLLTVLFNFCQKISVVGTHWKHLKGDVSIEHNTITMDIGLDKKKKKIERKIVNIFLHISLNIWFVCSKEPFVY